MGHRNRHYTVRMKTFGYCSSKKTSQIAPIIRRAEIKSGQTNEDVVGRILADFKEQGKIKHFFPTERNGRDDKRGIDYIAILWNSDKIGIQVKGCRMGLRKFARQRREHDYINPPSITSVFAIMVVPDYMQDSKPLERIISKELGIPAGAE